jgi:glutathione synthase/RimK-type ligase-like ATP-grasp enzyme
MDAGPRARGGLRRLEGGGQAGGGERVSLDVVFATFMRQPELDGDDRGLGEACSRIGIRWEAHAWDSGFDWSSARCVVVRSTWDYSRRRDQFLAWARRVQAATMLLNPASVLEWNTEKSYLLELARRGVPVIPTLVHEPEPCDLDALLARLGWEEAVVKPVVSAGSWRTYRVRRGDRSHDAVRARRLLAVRRCLVQPFLKDVVEGGERAVVCIDGEISHAVRKRSLFETDRPFMQSVSLDTNERGLAERVLDAAGARGLLYARVDLVRDDSGRPVLMELELTEPRLFLASGGQAACDRLARGIARRLEARRLDE